MVLFETNHEVINKDAVLAESEVLMLASYSPADSKVLKLKFKSPEPFVFSPESRVNVPGIL